MIQNLYKKQDFIHFRTEREERMKKSNDIQSRRKQLKLRITIVILIFLLAAIGLGVHVVQNYIPSREHMSLTEYYGQPSDGEMVVVLVQISWKSGL